MSKHSLKSSGGNANGQGTGVSRVSNTTGSSKGGNSLKSDHHVANDGKGAGSGMQYGRYASTKPSSDSGSVGTGQPLKTAAAKKYEPSTRGALTHKSTKPNR